MNWTKKELMKTIESAHIGIEMSKQILQAIKEFEHCKQVNKRFTDRMKELGCHAYIQKDDYSTTLSISNQESWKAPKVEFRVYVSHIMSKSNLTWERIKTEIERYDFQKRLEEAKNRIQMIEKETLEAKELLNIIKSKKFSCFDFCKSIYEIEGAITEALK